MEEAFEGADVVYPKSWGWLDAFTDERRRSPSPRVRELDLRRAAARAREAGRPLHALPAGRPRQRGHRRGDRRPALGRLRRGRKPHAHRQGADGADDGRLRPDATQARSRRDRRQLADPRQAPPDRPRPVHRRGRDVLAHRGDDHRRLGRGDRPRQRTTGRVHPAPVGARRARAARGAARGLRRRQPGRDRLRARPEPRERLPAARHRPPRRRGGDPSGGRRRRPGLRQPHEAHRVVHGRGDGPPPSRRGRLGRRRGRGPGWRRVVASPPRSASSRRTRSGR